MSATQNPKESTLSTSTDIRYPNITVQLTGEDGNAFFMVARVSKALKGAGVSAEERDAFRDEAMSGDYDHVLQTIMRWVDTR